MNNSTQTPSPIYVIDTGFGRPDFDAAYLVTHGGRAAFVDCGTHYSVPRLLATLEAAGLQRAAVDWVILTHVHLDHAGGAGELMAQLPHARLVVHPRGKRHMIDPTQLWAGASAVYGEETMARTYGQLRPVPAGRVLSVEDGQTIDLGGRQLQCFDTPGHARHHITVYDPTARVCFTGDTFGLSYREFDTARGPLIVPTTSPVQFDPEALHATIDRLVALKPEAMYLTHYGRVEDVERLARDMHAQIDLMVAIAERSSAAPHRHAYLVEALTELYLARANAHGWEGDRDALCALLQMDIELNAQGLEVWMDNRNRDRGH